MRGRKPKPQLYLIDGDDDPGSEIQAQAQAAHPSCASEPKSEDGMEEACLSLHLRSIIGDNDRAVLPAYCQSNARRVEAKRKLARRRC